MDSMRRVAAGAEKRLDICLYGNVISVHGTRSYHIGRIQRGR